MLRLRAELDVCNPYQVSVLIRKVVLRPQEHLNVPVHQVEHHLGNRVVLDALAVRVENSEVVAEVAEDPPAQPERLGDYDGDLVLVAVLSHLVSGELERVGKYHCLVLRQLSDVGYVNLGDCLQWVQFLQSSCQYNVTTLADV